MTDKAANKLDEFIAYLNEQVQNHGIYVWGGQGEKAPKITEAWIRAMESSSKQPKTNANRAIAYWKKQVAAGYGDKLRAFDCSGLGVYWLCDLQKLWKGDVTADTIMDDLCTRISRSQLKRGDMVFCTYSNGNAYHVGYVVDDALNVVEAKGRDDGVVKRKLSAGSWNRYGRPKVFASIINGAANATGGTDSKSLVAGDMRMVLRGDRGDDVTLLQQLLIAAGYACGNCGADGVFGAATQAAVTRYQKSKGLQADGIVGPKTWGALLGK